VPAVAAIALSAALFDGASPMLFDTFSARSLPLANRLVMAPMTRSRATPDHLPDALMATYYG
jgi:N-ethylmaleimide reductase